MNNIFLVRGTYLTSLALTCQNMSVITLKAIAEHCVKLQMLWYRSNHFTPNSQVFRLGIFLSISSKCA